ncbi:MAG: hypothetical protein R3F16_23625 [Myxococcota bacterium]
MRDQADPGGAGRGRLRGRSGWLVGLGLLAWVACSGGAAGPPDEVVAELPEDPTSFSSRGMTLELEELGRLAPREREGASDLAARARIGEALGRAGLRVETLVEGDRRHLLAERPGRSGDVVLLVVGYFPLAPEEAEDDAGSVLLLELARVLALRPEPPPYTLWLAWADALGGPALPPEAELDPARRRSVEAGRSLARAIGPVAGSRRIRAVLTFEPRARAALRIARDLRSQPVHRALFQDVAEARRRTGLFPPADAGLWTTSEGLHVGFREAGFAGLLALVDESLAGAEGSPRLRGDAGAARPVGSALVGLGEVTVDALDRMMRRFANIDAFRSRGPSGPCEAGAAWGCRSSDPDP